MQKQKTALITGITGQDGAYLAQLLLKKNYKVYGTYRRLSTPNFWRLISLGIEDQINLIPADLIDTPSLIESIKISQPHELYNLAAQSFVGSSFDQPITSSQFSGLSVVRILESIRLIDPKIKFYQASSSELYGKVSTKSQNENTTFTPQSPYAISKLYGYWMTKIYRDGYNMFGSNGILFNHESPRRGSNFVTSKVIKTAVEIKKGITEKLVMGNLDSYRDWGHSKDYVRAMHLILNHSIADDFVVATGHTRSVRDLVDLSFKTLGMNYSDYVVQDKKFMRPEELPYLKGDSTKIRTTLKWQPEISFESMIEEMTSFWFDKI